MGTSVDQPEPEPEPGHVPPAIQVVPRGNEAGPSNQPPQVVPYPYQLDEVIERDFVQSIQQRLLAKYSYTPHIGIMYVAKIKAKDLFEGARAFENLRTTTGEHSLDKLHTLLSDLKSRGINFESFSSLKGKRKAKSLLAGSCVSGNVHVRLRDKDGGKKWPCCTSLSSSMGSALSFLGEYANMILMRCGALHLTFVGLLSSGAYAPAFLCNKPLRPKNSGRWSYGAFRKRVAICVRTTIYYGEPSDDLSKIRGDPQYWEVRAHLRDLQVTITRMERKLTVPDDIQGWM
ncbi:hypothetical protein KY284_023932 [Solanum tuberosum]|nr:hypothetical protein KY284_023932 [Solanum tuberosum]